jgi:hypothetical protein
MFLTISLQFREEGEIHQTTLPLTNTIFHAPIVQVPMNLNYAPLADDTTGNIDMGFGVEVDDFNMEIPLGLPDENLHDDDIVNDNFEENFETHEPAVEVPESDNEDQGDDTTFVKRYLFDILNKLKDPDFTGRSIYQQLSDGNIFIQPPNPSIALRQNLESGKLISPEPFYLPRTFIWIPEYIFPYFKLACPKYKQVHPL